MYPNKMCEAVVSYGDKLIVKSSMAVLDNNAQVGSWKTV